MDERTPPNAHKTQPERQCGQMGLHKVTGTLQQKF
jgi:hypothetical protein